MKRCVLVSVFMLMLITISSGSAWSRVHPDEYISLDRPSGEDHPWGGENVTVEIIKTSLYDYFGRGPTGLLLIDIMFTRLLPQPINSVPITRSYTPDSREAAVIKDQIDLTQSPEWINDFKQGISQ
jgi:hypothetical protein